MSLDLEIERAGLEMDFKGPSLVAIGVGQTGDLALANPHRWGLYLGNNGPSSAGINIGDQPPGNLAFTLSPGGAPQVFKFSDWGIFARMRWQAAPIGGATTFWVAELLFRPAKVIIPPEGASGGNDSTGPEIRPSALALLQNGRRHAGANFGAGPRPDRGDYQ